MSAISQSVRNRARRSSAVRQFFGDGPQVFRIPVENALKAVITLPAWSQS